jgi:hypothetical protein
MHKQVFKRRVKRSKKKLQSGVSPGDDQQDPDGNSDQEESEVPDNFKGCMQESFINFCTTSNTMFWLCNSDTSFVLEKCVNVALCEC